MRPSLGADMKAKLTPIYFKSAEDADFARQLSQLKLLAGRRSRIPGAGRPGRENPGRRRIVRPGRRDFPRYAGRRLPPLEGFPGAAPAGAGGHLRVRHGLHVGLGDQQLPGRQWRQGDRPQHARKDPPGLPGAGVEKACSRARNSWSTRITPPAPVCRTRSSSASTGGSPRRSPPSRAATGCRSSKRASRSWAQPPKPSPMRPPSRSGMAGKPKRRSGR